jgi:hypothetical protein
MIRTIETDPDSPFLPAEVPAAEWTFRHVLAERVERGSQHLASWAATARLRSLPTYPTGSSGRTVEAFVNHGRWMWRCPTCPAAQVASLADPRAFCVECFNDGDGYHDVVFPDDRTRLQLETLLGRRPNRNRNWTPEETVEQLQLENLALGLTTDAPTLEPTRYEYALPLVRDALTSRRALEAN